jgi:hypothetical protein
MLTAHQVVKCTRIRKTEGLQSHWYVQKLKTEPAVPHVNCLFYSHKVHSTTPKDKHIIVIYYSHHPFSKPFQHPHLTHMS